MPPLSSRLIIIVLVAVSFAMDGADSQTLESPQITTWGRWGSWYNCPPNQFVVGFQLKVEARQGDGRNDDDTALNNIRLYCAHPDSPYSTTVIADSSQGWGSYRAVNRCSNGVAVGFQLRSERSLGSGDDTAANDFQVTCSDGAIVTGDGMAWGVWTGWRTCSPGRALCGIQSQFEGPCGECDDTALNNIRMQCCTLPPPKNPADGCQAKDSWAPVYRCISSPKLTLANSCKFQKTEGISLGTTRTSGGYSEQTLSTSVTTGIKATAGILESNFQVSVGTSSTTGYNWARSNENIWHSETTKSAEMNVAPGDDITIEQVVGYCGPYQVKTSTYRFTPTADIRRRMVIDEEYRPIDE